MTSPQRLYTQGIIIGCALVLLLGVLMPRALSFMPALIALIGFAAWPLAYPRQPLPASKPVLIFATGVIGLALLSTLWAIDPAYALERSIKVAGPVLGGALFFGVVRQFNQSVLLRMWWVLPATLLLACAIQVFDFHYNFMIFRLIRSIDANTPINLYEANRASVVLCVLAPIMGAMIWVGLRDRGVRMMIRILAVATYALAFLLVLQETAAQSAQLAFISGFAVLALMPVKIKGLWPALMILLCMILIAFPFAVPKFFSSIPRMAYEAGEDADMPWTDRANVLPRLEVWDYVSRYALQKPLTGFGIEATRKVPAFDTQEIYQPGKTNLHPHNGILQIWIEFGLIGIALACAAGIALISRIKNLPDNFQRRLALSTFASLMSVGLVGFGLWQAWWLGLIALSAGLTMLTIRMAD